jgi:hypothetical protein
VLPGQIDGVDMEMGSELVVGALGSLFGFYLNQWWQAHMSNQSLLRRIQIDFIAFHKLAERIAVLESLHIRERTPR